MILAAHRPAEDGTAPADAGTLPIRAAAVLAAGAGGGRSAAVELVALVRDAVAAGAERQVLLLRLPALLRGGGRGARHAGLLREALAPLRQHPRLRVFDLPNGDVAAVGGPRAPQLEAAHGALRAMLEDGPGPDGRPPAAVRLHRLPEEAAAVLAAIEDALGLTAAASPPGHAAGAAQAPRAPLDGAGLAAAERALAMADLTPFLRRQAVCRLSGEDGAAPEPLWEERRVPLAEIGAVLLPRSDLAAAPHLARRLRRALDRRLLAELARPEELRDLHPLLLPLALESATSAEFLRFDALLPSRLRAGGGLAVALSAEDVLRDPAGYAFARDVLRLRGHRVVLDLSSPALAPLLPMARVRFDLLRLDAQAVQAEAEPGAMARLRAALPAEPGRVVLSEVERPAAIAWGWEMGITLFQGRLVERRRIFG
ncbi:hypothetical protein [Caldovatus aquaticus]|uniref:EAL domain-containing protein n=1 Tax=Caldovatus aquaticus TaxID=2865671 RepID=A0ABS7F337_9PROT|nr:hypothetical protein [Caldovatus aquaticus]MBW8269215.1 hypothetical protein [Caldovatus aquaticus]